MTKSKKGKSYEIKRSDVLNAIQKKHPIISLRKKYNLPFDIVLKAIRREMRNGFIDRNSTAYQPKITAKGIDELKK